MNKLEQAARHLLEVADGIQHGTDWNNGTHAKIYRPKFPAAITALREALAEPQITTPDVCGEVCVRAKLCYGCGKALDEANASWMSHEELKAYWSGYGNGKQKALSEPVAFKFPREPKPEQSMGWTIDYGLISQIAEDIGDQEFIPSHEGIELVLLSLEGIYAAPVQQAEHEPVAVYLGYTASIGDVFRLDKEIPVGTKLYTHPVRTKDLTDEEIEECVHIADSECTEDACMPWFVEFARAVIAADREKNK